MTDNINNNKETVLVALDIVKNSHDAAVQFPSGKRLFMKVANTIEGYRLLLTRCQPKRYQIHIGFEPTGDYHRNVAYWFSRYDCKCFLISSLSCARAREMLHNTWDENDRKDANVVLYLMNQKIMQPFHDPIISGIFDVQEVCNTYHQISLARTRCMN